jgi:hypothetical protein
MLRFKQFCEDAGVGLAPVAANHMGSSSSTAGTGGIDTFDPLLKRRLVMKRKLLKDRDVDGRGKV